MERGGITPFQAAYDQDYTQEIVPFAETVLFSILAPEHRGLSSGKRLHKGDTAWDKGVWLGKSETNSEQIVGTKDGAMGARTIRRLEPTKRSETSLLLEIQGSALEPGTKRTASWRRKKYLTPAPALPPVHENLTDDTPSSSSDSSSSSSSSTQAPSGIPQHVNDQAQGQTNSRSQPQTVMGANVLVVSTSTVSPTPIPKALIRSSKPTKRAAAPTTLDVPPQAKHPRGEGSQMDVRSIIVAGVTISGSEDEDPAECFDSREDAGELLDPLVDNAETEEATKPKLKELERLAEFGACEIVDVHTALNKKRVTTRWDLDHRKDGIRARFVARGFNGDETMYDVFAPRSTPSTERVIDCLSLKKSYHTFTADVTNAYFHVNEDEECYVEPPAEWLEQQAALGNPTCVLWRLRKQLCGLRRAGTRWVDFTAERLGEQSFEGCGAAPQFFANYELDVFIAVHRDDLHGTGPRPALDLVQTNLSQKIRFKIWTEYEVGMNTNTSSVSECCTMTRLRSHPTQNT